MLVKNRLINLVTSCAFIVSLSVGHAYAKDLNVVSWGGLYTKSQVKAYHEPYSKKYGTKINSIDYNGGLAEIKAQVEAGNVTWDVIDVEFSDAVRGCDEGLLETIDASTLPHGDDGTSASEDFINGGIQECAVASIIWSTIYAYNSEAVEGTPTTIADFFDLKKFPGKRGVKKNPKIALEFALMADGVPAKDVYKTLSTPQGVDRAFAKLDSIKNHIVWWEAGAQPPQLLADGEVVMTTAFNGRVFGAIANENKPFVIVWDGQVYDMDLFVMPKGTKNKKEAMRFIQFSTTTQALADQAAWISYGPARKSSAPKVGKHAEGGFDMAPHMPTAPNNFKNALQNDFQWWADHQDEMNERFNAWLSN